MGDSAKTPEPELERSAPAGLAWKRSNCSRRARWGDRVWIAVAGATVLSAWYRLPLLAQQLQWVHRSSVGLAGRFSSLGTEISWVLEWTLTAGLLYGFQATLIRFELARLRLSRLLLGLVGALVISGALASLAMGLNVRPVFIPIVLAALWARASFGMATGLVTLLYSVAISALSGAADVLSVALLVRAVALVLLFGDGKNPRNALRAGIFAGLLAAGVELTTQLGTWTSWAEPSLVVMWYTLGGLGEGILYVFTRGTGERILGHVSRERLVELLDLSQPLLQRMVHRAPGSFEHSRAMANLAEQAASSIGADALLTRVGAYYHDLGKSIEPDFFVENLKSGQVSAHEGMSPKQSAAHIVAHVVGGVQILRNENVPEPVVEFAYTHHGSQFVEYFLNKERIACDKEGRDVNVEDFRYPGMKPTTTETAILMVVDSIEAASRTIESPDRDRLEDMVRRIVFSKLAGEQLDESGLTMKQLRIVCSRVVETLVHMNHHRIKYPWQEERAREFGLKERELESSETVADQSQPISSYSRNAVGVA